MSGLYRYMVAGCAFFVCVQLGALGSLSSDTKTPCGCYGIIERVDGKKVEAESITIGNKSDQLTLKYEPAPGASSIRSAGEVVVSLDEIESISPVFLPGGAGVYQKKYKEGEFIKIKVVFKPREDQKPDRENGREYDFVIDLASKIKFSDNKGPRGMQKFGFDGIKSIHFKGYKRGRMKFDDKKSAEVEPAESVR